MQRKDYDFGYIKSFVEFQRPKKTHTSKKDLSLEKRRYIVISKESCGNLFLVLYKDHDHYMKQKVLRRERLDSTQFCGITQGKLASQSSESESKPGALKSYLAIIFLDFTAMLMFSETDLRRICPREIEKIGRSLGHTKTKSVTMDSAPHLDEKVSPRAGKSILMCLTKERLSLACLQNHHRCCRSWPLADIRPDSLTVPTSLHIDIHRFGTYSFSSGSSDDSIFKEVRKVLSQIHGPKPVQKDITGGESTTCSGEDTSGRDPYLISPDYITVPDVVPARCKPTGVDWNQVIVQLQQIARSRMDDMDTYITTYIKHCIHSQNSSTPAPCMRRRASEDLFNSYMLRTGTLPRGPVSMPLHLVGPSEEPPAPPETSRQMDDPSSDCNFTQAFDDVISETIRNVLKETPWNQDTLKLEDNLRTELCLMMYRSVPFGFQMESWEVLAQEIGLGVQANNLIASVVRNHRLPIPAAEVVLRHWQYVYNKYGCTGPGGKCPYHCTREQLLYILQHHVQRHELVQLVESEDRHSWS